MAGRLIGPWDPALDSDGDPINGAKLYTCATGTLTPKLTYTDSTLNVANANPLVADSAGRFPQAWAADLELFRVVWKSAADAQIGLWDDVQAQGEDPLTFSRDLGSSGRFQIRGEDGVVQIEVGDPTGDDTGGSGRLGGWEGSSGDDLDLDFDKVSVGGYEIALLRLEAGTVTNQPSKVIALPSGYDRFRLEIIGFIPQVADDALGMVFSHNAGVSYIASGYANKIGNPATAAALLLTGPCGVTGADRENSGSWEIYRKALRTYGLVGYHDTTAADDVTVISGGSNTSDTNLADHIKLKMVTLGGDGGNLNLTYALYGYKHLTLGVTS